MLYDGLFAFFNTSDKHVRFGTTIFAFGMSLDCGVVGGSIGIVTMFVVLGQEYYELDTILTYL